jgi:DNA processing protein
VISGLARGIDGATHQGTVAAGGRGTAVLGCGPDVWYPPEHKRLGEQLLAAGGGIISEYPLGAPPLGWRFPPRNRIISGLSGAVVIVEAARRGGALITARLALHQGREVLAVPGDVHRATSQGCNLLIRDGAIPVMDSDDLVEAISLILGPPTSRRPDQGPADELVEALGGIGRTVDWLADHLDLPVPEVLVRVSRLEAGGVVTRSGAMITRAPGKRS